MREEKYWVLHIGFHSRKVCLAGLSVCYGCMDLDTCKYYIESAVALWGDGEYFLVDEFLYDRFWRDYLS